MSYVPKDAVTQSFRNNKGVISVNEVSKLIQEDKYTNFGQLELIATTTLSNNTEVDFTNLGTGYQKHLITLNNIHTADNKDLNLRVFVNGTVQTASTDYMRCFRNMFQDGNQYEDKDVDLDRLRLNAEIGGNSPEGFSGMIYLYNALFGGKTYLTQQQTATDHNSLFKSYYGAGSFLQSVPIDGIRFYMSSGNLISGIISLYGIKSYS